MEELFWPDLIILSRGASQKLINLEKIKFTQVEAPSSQPPF